MNKNSRNIALALSLGLLTLASCKSGNKAETTKATQTDSTRLVAVDAVRTDSLDLSEEYTSMLQARVTNNITAQSGGRLKQLLVKIGDRVGQGQVIARLEDTQMAQAQVQLSDAKTAFARADELYKVGGISKAQWDTAKSGLDRAQLVYRNLAENTILRSPISGVVTAKNYDNGDMTSPSQPIVVVEQISPVKALVNVSEQHYSALKHKLTATLTVDALNGAEFTGYVSNIYPTLNTATHTVPVEVEVANKDGQLRPGMYVRVRLDLGAMPALTVADKAIVRQSGSGDRYVYVYKDGKAEYRVIRLGAQQGDRYQVLEGLSEGEQVIVTSPNTLKNGAAVRL